MSVAELNTDAGILDDERLHRFHRKLTLLSAGGAFLDGYDLAVIGAALPFITKTFHLSTVMQSWTVGSVLIGNMIGMLIFGFLADKLGRRAMYVIALLSFVVFAALTAVSTQLWELLLFRTLLGVGIGADYTISPALVAEFNPAARRGARVGSLSLWFFVGGLLSYVLGIVLAPFGIEAWRILLGFGALLALVVLVLRRQIPESPRWLSAKHRAVEAGKVLEDLAGTVKHFAPVHLNKKKEIELPVDRRLPTLLGRVIFVSAFWFAWDVMYYGVTLFAPSIVKASAHGSTFNADLAGGSLSIVSIIGTLVCIYLLVDRFGRRPLLIFGFLGLAIPLFVLALIHNPSVFVLVILLDLGVMIGNFGPGVLPWIYATDLFPTKFRALGTGIGAFSGRVGGLLGVFLFPSLVEHLGLAHATYLFVGVGIFGCVVAFVWAPETKGRSLESLEAGLVDND
ncbi:MAG: MFS transporter [Ferrimicrobium sp.]